MHNTEKFLILGMIVLLSACASDERTKILEANVKNMEVYASDGQLICKEMPCPIKFNKKEGKSQTVKLKLDGFEGEEEVSVKIWNDEYYARRAGSSLNVVSYPISTIDAPIIGVTVGPTNGCVNEGNFGDNPLLSTTEHSPLGSTRGTINAAMVQMRMVNDVWFYDPDHIYIDVKLCGKSDQCVAPKYLGYEGYGYEVTKNPELWHGNEELLKSDLIKKETITSASLIKKGETITKRFVLHNYAEIKAHNGEYMRALVYLTGLKDNELQEIIDKSKSAPELAEILARYSRKNQKGAK